MTKDVFMIRFTIISTLVLGLAVAGSAGHAQAAESSGHARKAAKSRRAPERAAPAAPAAGINAPSTDFSKIERSDDGSGGPDGPTFRPTMGAGGMGLGGSF